MTTKKLALWVATVMLFAVSCATEAPVPKTAIKSAIAPVTGLQVWLSFPAQPASFRVYRSSSLSADASWTLITNTTSTLISVPFASSTGPVFFRAMATLLNPQSIMLAWDPEIDPTITGYAVHYGPRSGEYTNTISAGDVSAFPVDGLLPGNVYFFAVTSSNIFGLESGPSNEVSYSVPDAVRPFLVSISFAPPVESALGLPKPKP